MKAVFPEQMVTAVAVQLAYEVDGLPFELLDPDVQAQRKHDARVALITVFAELHEEGFMLADLVENAARDGFFGVLAEELKAGVR